MCTSDLLLVDLNLFMNMPTSFKMYKFVSIFMKCSKEYYKNRSSQFYRRH